MGCAGRRDFNPRPHAGDDERHKYAVTQQKISTHVPTRGTTCLIHSSFPPIFHFNPRPHAGDDDWQWRTAITGSDFNPRPHAGDDCDVMRQCRNFFISTHVPTRGTTAAKTATEVVSENFNPRPHAGDDEAEPPSMDISLISTHVPTRGTTAVEALRYTSQGYFNPRPHAGDDASIVWQDTLKFEFQPTSPRGGRLISHSVTSVVF